MATQMIIQIFQCSNQSFPYTSKEKGTKDASRFKYLAMSNDCEMIIKWVGSSGGFPMLNQLEQSIWYRTGIQKGKL